MRFLVALAMLPALARADALSDGEQLAKRGRYTEALAKLREADAAHPTATSACLIGLVHLRSGHAPEAEVRFAECRARGEPPDWLPGVEAELAAQLAKLALVTITGANGDVEVSGWRDAPFARRTIHLPQGHYELRSGEARGQVDVVDEEPVRVLLVAPRAEPGRGERLPGVRVVAREPATRTSTYALGAGVGLALIGLAVHAFILAPARSTLDGDVDGAQYDRDYPAFGNARIGAIALYAGAAIALGVGLYLRAGEHVTIAPTQVAVRW